MNNNASSCYVHDWYLQYPNGPYWIIPDFQYPYNPPLVTPQPLKVWSTVGLSPTISSVEYPEVNIMVNNNRVRKISSPMNVDAVYLNAGEFAIEMFNKSQVTLGAKIKLNGKYISTSHLILYPGQRLVLDRYIDTKDKFKFTVYNVDSNNSVVEQAIKNNGELEIEFYQEFIEPPQTYTLFNSNLGTINTENNNFYCNTLTDAAGPIGTTTVANSYGNSTLTSSLDAGERRYAKSTKETGLVEKGSQSQQDLTYVNKTFNTWTLTVTRFKLLPLSEKPVEAKDLVNYCSNCGTKTNRNHKFCSNCGTKIE